MRVVLENLAEVVFVLIGLAGLAWWSPPAAAVAGGVLGALAIERVHARRERKAKLEQARREQTGMGLGL